MRRLGELGAVAYREYRDGVPPDRLQWVQDLVRARAARYGDDVSTDFVQRLAASAGDGPAQWSVLSLNGVDISWHVGFFSDSILYWYLPSYDEAYQAYSPGKVHLHHAIAAAFDRGAKGLDFLRGQESYKFGWTDGDQFQMQGFGMTSSSLASQLRLHAAVRATKLGYVTAWARNLAGANRRSA
jgi:CelD/BcsL family acetyltransferase involved in cellulose biosynthesis